MKITKKSLRALFSLLVVFTMAFGVFGAVPAAADSTVSTTYTFDEGSEGWTALDVDSDGHNWFWTGDFTGIYTYYADITNGWTPSDDAYGGTGYAMASGSYVNGVGELSPDNYLISPQVELGGSISFYAHPMDENYYAERFGVFVSTAGNTDPADFTEVESWTLTAEDWHQYTVDLSDYSGQGYIAIRHYDCYDEYIFMVDEVTIVEPDIHVHDFTYTGEGDTITATCTKEGCDLTDSKVSFSIVAPEKTHYGDGKSPEATLSGVEEFNEVTGLNVTAEGIQYIGNGDTEYGPSETAPTAPGTYTAGILAGEDETYRAASNMASAVVNYEILPAELTITAEPKEKNEGEDDPELTYTVEGLVEGDTVTGALDREPGEDPGEYDILIGTISAGDNYTINYVGAKLTIKAVEKPDPKPDDPDPKPDDPKPPVDPDKPDVPDTGDSSDLMLYAGMMLISLSVLAAVTAKKRYNK